MSLLRRALQGALILLFLPATLLAQETYATAQVEAGQLTLLRQGTLSRHQAGGGAVPVRLGDLLRLSADSRVRLETQEGAQLRLGSNAVLQIQPWRLRAAQGYVKMVYGKLRIQQPKLTKSARPFRIRTAMAVTGVKGTRWDQETSPQGNLVVHTLEGTVGLQGLEGAEQEVTAGYVSAVINGQAAKPPVPAPPQMQRSAEQGRIDAPQTDSPDAQNLSSAESLTQTGLASEQELEQAQETQVSAQSDLSEAPVQRIEPPAEVDPEFAKDYADSQDLPVEELEVSLNLSSTERAPQHLEEGPAQELEVPETDLSETEVDLPDTQDAVEQSLVKEGWVDIQIEN